jgi:hypothetical protein
MGLYENNSIVGLGNSTPLCSLIISNLIHTDTTPEKYTREEISLSQSTRQNTIFNVFYKVDYERNDSSIAHFSIYFVYRMMVEWNDRSVS